VVAMTLLLLVLGAVPLRARDSKRGEVVSLLLLLRTMPARALLLLFLVMPLLTVSPCLCARVVWRYGETARTRGVPSPSTAAGDVDEPAPLIRGTGTAPFLAPASRQIS
jgi:hypothetical protein